MYHRRTVRNQNSKHSHLQELQKVIHFLSRLTKHAQNLYAENYKTLLREIEEDLDEREGERDRRTETAVVTDRARSTGSFPVLSASRAACSSVALPPSEPARGHKHQPGGLPGPESTEEPVSQAELCDGAHPRWSWTPTPQRPRCWCGCTDRPGRERSGAEPGLRPHQCGRPSVDRSDAAIEHGTGSLFRKEY